MLALQLARQRPCVVTRRPSSRPASASWKAPVQMLAVRRDAWLASRRKATKAGVDGITSMAPATMMVSKPGAPNAASPPARRTN
jgi:hypothetical protein